MRILIGVVALALLAGCSTPSDLMAGNPVSIHISTKKPKDIALCVYPAWQDYRSTSVMSETQNGYRIIAGTDSGQTDDVLNIELAQQGSGSIVKLYQRASWSQIGRGGLVPSLNRCL
ncbi:hypothetical protein DNK59_10545 [Pseudomonas sp. TKO26]|uniref:hypothetical protein n=1 Tax=unclassified Pseudomonas TaxID=196821 RepID=UPI000D99F54E|nr:MULTISPECIES: hypothetical protein [unclassified Pseudomonas]PYY88084.1 hypothetical protein DNK62_10545 [Pseudomonas sp. TKO30]PYY91067.1 hypothetical protein DNK61_10540 [Pseudomonas sp. TKO29]PYY93941.1 hypothetical protein DNK59_10545 [Pseudomonas sp. TKO26]PYZ00670.1 hypothetical protein DNK60_10540 [Pseudomonas sp. TKO14]